jgi:hypothetical protein
VIRIPPLLGDDFIGEPLVSPGKLNVRVAKNRIG